MLSPSDFNNAVPQFTNGDYASNPINPQYIAEPGAVDYNRGAEPLQTLPAQWWNWFLNKFTNRFNKLNIYVKNIFNELAQLLSVVSDTPSGTEGTPTVGQLKDMFETKYPALLSNTFVPQTTTINGNALSGNITICGVACACCGKNGNSYSAFGSNAFNSTAFTTCTGTVTQVKVGNTAYNPTDGVVCLPAPTSPTCVSCACTLVVVSTGCTGLMWTGSGYNTISPKYVFGVHPTESNVDKIARFSTACLNVGHASSANTALSADSSACTSAIKYITDALCLYTSGQCYCLCNRCPFPVIFTPMANTDMTCIGQYTGKIIYCGYKACVGYCSSGIGTRNCCLAGFRVY